MLKISHKICGTNDFSWQDGHRLISFPSLFQYFSSGKNALCQERWKFFPTFTKFFHITVMTRFNNGMLITSETVRKCFLFLNWGEEHESKTANTFKVKNHDLKHSGAASYLYQN